jgi:hypothetical protein
MKTTKWEYIPLSGCEIEGRGIASFNKLGEEGWELVCFVPDSRPDILLFKRPLAEPEAEDDTWIPNKPAEEQTRAALIKEVRVSHKRVTQLVSVLDLMDEALMLPYPPKHRANKDNNPYWTPAYDKILELHAEIARREKEAGK